MSRKLKRVPLDFDWPKHLVWKGYQNPYHPTECEICDGSGHNPATKQLADDWYDFSRTGRKWNDQLTQDEVDYLKSEHRLVDFGEHPTAEEVNTAVRRGPLVHDAINRYLCVEYRAKKLGVYGNCPVCKGQGHYWCDERFEDLYENWERIDPPSGPGYQLWENVSEGSPVSPVFATLDALSAWCEEHATTFADFRATAGEWKTMLRDNNVHARMGNNIFV